MPPNFHLFIFPLITIAIILTTPACSSSIPKVSTSSDSAKLATELASTIIKTLIERSLKERSSFASQNIENIERGRSLISRSMLKGRGNNGKNRNAMRPVEPLPVGTMDYFTPVINLLNNAKKIEHNLKKQTYSYGLMVVGRPLEELTLPQKFVRAALMPGKYYQDATSDLAKQFNKYILKEKKSNHHFQVKSKSTNPTKNGLQWANVLIQLLSMASNALPTPVVKS